ncbi:MAG: hypothetical protein ABIH21_04515 [Patescibacteria group bacterium]
MSKTPNYDKLIQPILDSMQTGEKTCELSGEKWETTERELEAYRKHMVPPPPHSPLMRHRFMTAMFPGGQWWYSKHPETGKSLISPVHPATGIKVLPDVEWHAKDFTSFAKEVDLHKSFLDQVLDLRLAIPSAQNRNFEPAENSIAVVSLGDVNSYFVVLSKSKNTFFSVSALDTESSAEVYNSNAITNGYFISHCERMHTCQYARESKDCMNCDFVFDCRNCENCFGATNKRNKNFLWFNEQLSEEEWKQKRAEVDLGIRSQAQAHLKHFDELMSQCVWPENFNMHCENCVGEYLTKATNCEYVYYADGGANNEYHNTWAIGQCEGNTFCDSLPNAQNCYYCSDASSSSNCRFCYLVSRSQDLEYCTECFDCENCFGCVGLKHKKFHILNKEYSEQDYWAKVDEIKCAMMATKEYGQFLPQKSSPAWFMEGGAVRYYNSTRELGEKMGAHMFDPESADAVGDELMGAKVVINTKDLPDSVDELEPFVGKVLYDEKYDRRFAYLKPEFELYKKLRIAPPTVHHVKRLLDLTQSSQTPEFTTTSCSQCAKDLIVSVNPGFPKRNIYCNQCYLKYMEERG